MTLTHTTQSTQKLSNQISRREWTNAYSLIKSGPITAQSSKSLIMNSERLIADQERRFRLACEQIVQLDYELEYLESRYNKRETLRRSYLIQLHVVINEELRKLYFIFATRKAEIIHDMTEVVQRD